MTRVAIIAAMPGELKPLVRAWPHSSRGNIHFWAQRTEEEEWMAACAGVGQAAATRAFAAIEDGGPIDLVLSYGWAGALMLKSVNERLLRLGVVAIGVALPIGLFWKG